MVRHSRNGTVRRTGDRGQGGESKTKSKQLYFTYTRFRVVADFSSLGTIARATGRRRLTLVLAAQRRATQSGCKTKRKRMIFHSRAYLVIILERNVSLRCDAIETLTTRRLFVRVVVAVLVPVAQLRLVHALWPFVRSTLRAQVFARACQRGTVEFVGTVVAVGVPVALVIQRYAQSVPAPKLTHVTGGEIWRRVGTNQ